MYSPNDFGGTDSQRIEAALKSALAGERVLNIPPRKAEFPGDRDYWLIDRAILLPEDFTVILDGCTIQLSDNCRDNFFRSVNCGIGISSPEPIKNIRIIGRNGAVLLGAARPRATGDGAKVLGERTYGTDSGKKGEYPKGDWRNIGILFSKVNGFEISGIKMAHYHCWAISLEFCSYGRVADIEFEGRNQYFIDGADVRFLNQDGVDLRKGCHHIDIENISGFTGDDTVALTAINPVLRKGGTLGSTEVTGVDSIGEVNDLHHVNIRNIRSYSSGGHHIIRLLNTRGIRIYDVLIENVVDTSASSASGVVDRATIRIGDSNPAWGGVTPLGDTFNITIRNVDSRSHHAVLIPGSLTDSTISDIIDRNGENPVVLCVSGEENMQRVKIENCRAAIKNQ